MSDTASKTFTVEITLTHPTSVGEVEGAHAAIEDFLFFLPENFGPNGELLHARVVDGYVDRDGCPVVTA